MNHTINLIDLNNDEFRTNSDKLDGVVLMFSDLNSFERRFKTCLYSDYKNIPKIGFVHGLSSNTIHCNELFEEIK